MEPNHKLTNREISELYSDIEIHTMIDDFRGAFACWLIKQDESRSYNLAIKAIEAYTNWLENLEFPTSETVVKMTAHKVMDLTSEKFLCNIPEVFAMNQLGKGFVDLGALSRNVYYHILREHITQPL